MPRVGTRTITAVTLSHEQAAHLWGGGVTGELLQGRYDTDPVHAWFQKRHSHFGPKLVDTDGICRVVDSKGLHEWRVPYGIREALNQPLIWGQMVSKYPWYVTWVSPRTNTRLKHKEESLASAIILVTTRVQHVDPAAAIISRIGYDIPPKLRGKLPHKHLGYWCPCCMDARKFYPTVPEVKFYANKKVWSDEKQRYITSVRVLRLLRCKVCGITNRDAKFRRSNQPWEKRKFKRGVTRARRRR